MKEVLDRMKKCLRYDPESGLIVWIARPSQKATRCRLGEEAGCLNGQGYRVIAIDQKIFNAHQIAWYLFYGEWTSDGIDHRNTCKSDNRITNLRLASNSENHANVSLTAANTSGRKGVTWNKKCGKWHAQIKVNGKNKYLGLYSNIDEAHNAYVLAANENFGEFARTA